MFESNLRKLTLVKVGIDTLTLKYIIEYLKKSRCLIELDISWNRLSSEDLISLFEVLSTNRLLRYLNISWNNIQN